MPQTLTAVPTIELWDLVLVPLQGEIEDALAERISGDVLDRIHRRPTRGLVIDVTGLWMMDSHLCSMISRLALSAQLMGTETMLCGLGPEVAMTLQTMGLELPGVKTARTLEQALRRMGIGPVETSPTEPEIDVLEQTEQQQPALGPAPVRYGEQESG